MSRQYSVIRYESWSIQPSLAISRRVTSDKSSSGSQSGYLRSNSFFGILSSTHTRLASRPVGSTENRSQTAERQSSIGPMRMRSEEHTSELQSLMRISYAVFCLKKKKTQQM